MMRPSQRVPSQLVGSQPRADCLRGNSPASRGSLGRTGRNEQRAGLQANSESPRPDRLSV